MLNAALIHRLQCPLCRHAPLEVNGAADDRSEYWAGTLACGGCRAVFSIAGGVPDLVPEDRLADDQWKIWQDHLKGFQNRREDRIKKPAQVINRFGKADRIQMAFADFIGIREGSVLDIGCGPGKFRHKLGQPGPEYVGLDPIPLPETREFPYVRALAEYIPFRDHTFSDAVVLASLDHFKDLDAFFRELVRVLEPNGRFHLLQSIHDVRGPQGAVKAMAHWFKDRLEDRATRRDGGATVPKHMHEFDTGWLRGKLGDYFSIEREQPFDIDWYSPTRLFLTMRTPS